MEIDYTKTKSSLFCINEDCTRMRLGRRYFCNACYLRQRRNTPDGKRKHKNNWLQRCYGITIEDFESMLEFQNHQCAICSCEISLLSNKTNVDHNHETGEVRGLLCSSCNTMIALAKESKEVFLNAINYLNR